MGKKEQIEKVFAKAWDRDTCFPVVKDVWNEEVPEQGQCAVTALIVQKYYGGEIVYNKSKDHFWNKIGNKFIDFTRGQFPNIKSLRVDAYIEPADILNSPAARIYKTKSRYNLLKRRVEKQLQQLAIANSSY